MPSFYAVNSNNSGNSFVNKGPKGDISLLNPQAVPKLSDDAYMPGTEGKILDVYTRYMPTSGGRMDYKTGTIQQGYFALTMVADNAPTDAPTGFVTLDQIDTKHPAAVFSNGKWIDVTDFLAQQNLAAKTLSQSGSAEQTDTAKETYTWSLTREESAQIFGNAEWLYISEMTSDDPTFNPFTDARLVDMSALGTSRPTPFQLKQMQNESDLLTLERQNVRDARAAQREIVQQEWDTWNNDVTSRFQLQQGAEALQGHDLFKSVAAKMVSGQSMVDDYGYTNLLPMRAKESPGSLPLAADAVRLRGTFTFSDGRVLDYENMSWEEVQKRMNPSSSGAEAVSLDSVGLYGLSLDERKSFLESVQQLIDKNGLELNARDLQYIAGNGSQENAVKGIVSEVVARFGNQFQSEQLASPLQQLSDLISADRGLVQLMQKSYNFTTGKSWDDIAKKDYEYTLKVVDNAGKRLAEDQLIIESGDGQKQLRLSVAEYQQLDRKAITELLREKGETVQKATSKTNDSLSSGPTESAFVPSKGNGGDSLAQQAVSDSAAKTGGTTGSKTPLSYDALGKILGLKGNFAEKVAFLDSLKQQISEESGKLNKTLKGVLKKAGMEDVTKKITFAEDSKGRIVIQGNISAKQKKELARIINSDPQLVEQIKTQKARIDIATELGQDSPNVTSQQLDAARTQILKDYLGKKGVALESLRLEDHESGYKNFVSRDDQGNVNDEESFGTLLASNPELRVELQAYMERKSEQQSGKSVGSSDATRTLLSMKRGEVSEEAETTFDSRAGVRQLKGSVFAALKAYYTENKTSLDQQITNFSLKISSNGDLSVEDVELAEGSDRDAQIAAKKFLTSLFNDSIRGEARALGAAILDQHDDEHGDVQEYAHQIHIGQSGGSYKILSPDADQAALREMNGLTEEIGVALGAFFGQTMNIQESFSVQFNAQGRLSLNRESLSSTNAERVQKVLLKINAYLAAEESGENTEGMLRGDLREIADKLVALKEVQGKFHDRSFIPEEGIRFTVQNGK
ncbi:MAG: hypothetical protein ACRC10_09190 [Thermoguttaceae bacterium]